MKFDTSRREREFELLEHLIKSALGADVEIDNESDDETNDIADHPLAVELYETYDAFKNVGFNDKQAFQLLTLILRDALQTQ